MHEQTKSAGTNYVCLFLFTSGLRIHLGVYADEVINTEDECSCYLAVTPVREVEDGRGSRTREGDTADTKPGAGISCLGYSASKAT